MSPSEPGRLCHLLPVQPKEENITMAIIAEEFEFVVGADTHARTHTFTAVHSGTGALVDTAAFPATSSGMDRAIAWISLRAGGRTVFAAVEGTSSYGARLTQALLAAGIEVGEVRPLTRSSRALTGKSDPIDTEAAARSVLGRQRDQVMEPRAAGTRAALRILLASRSVLDHQRTRGEGSWATGSTVPATRICCPPPSVLPTAGLPQRGSRGSG